MYRENVSPTDAEGPSGAGTSRDPGRVVAGGFTFERVVVTMDGEDGFDEEEDGGWLWTGNDRCCLADEEEEAYLREFALTKKVIEFGWNLTKPFSPCRNAEGNVEKEWHCTELVQRAQSREEIMTCRLNRLRDALCKR
jgi:hypothetical protein